jgi:hypothetical protein
MRLTSSPSSKARATACVNATQNSEIKRRIRRQPDRW